MLQYDKLLIDKIHSQGSRNIVGYILGELSKRNDKIVAAYADVGSRFGLIKNLGSNGLQISIAEQSLIGVISGFFHEGFIPFGVAYAPFLTMRAADQIRMSIGEMNLGIKLIGGSAGLISANLGAASMALDDIAMMRSIPNLNILSPADCLEAAKMLEAASETEKPIYIRLTGNVMPEIYKEDFDYKIGKADIIADKGRDVVIYAAGMQVFSALKAAEMFEVSGIGCTVVNMSTIKPIDEKMIEKLSDIPLAVSVEEHNVIGGLGSAIADCLAEKNYTQKLLKIGVNDTYPAPGSYDDVCWRCGLTPMQIVSKINEQL